MAITKDNTNDQEIFGSYFERIRTDVLKQVPPEAKTVLSVGCAGGRTEAELIKRGARVYGIEMNPQAAQKARERGVTVFEGDASSVDLSDIDAEFDYLVYADVLEHLRDPEAVLKRHVGKLRSGGQVYICVPNFRHYSFFQELFVRGHARYRDAGILDNTHVRITTRKMIVEWCEQAGLQVKQRYYYIYKRRYQWLSLCTFGLFREFLAHQVGVVAVKPE